jgi:hypothetical protein
MNYTGKSSDIKTFIKWDPIFVIKSTDTPKKFEEGRSNALCRNANIAM